LHVTHRVVVMTAQGLPSFTWSEFPNVSHLGQPDVFDFQFELQDPNWSAPFPPNP
jgi:hypothetical protein